MDEASWAAFVLAEQTSPYDDSAENDASAAAEASDSRRRFATATLSASGERGCRSGLDAHAFRSLVLSPENNAVGPVRQSAGYLSHPLTAYWTACSHNSYLVGDQLTGMSTADAYRRHLLQGCRHVELDCWDGSNGRPVITHGMTFCTKDSFEAAAIAVAETAFATCDLPVILSLEMHCSPKQQRVIAQVGSN